LPNWFAPPAYEKAVLRVNANLARRSLREMAALSAAATAWG